MEKNDLEEKGAIVGQGPTSLIWDRHREVHLSQQMKRQIHQNCVHSILKKAKFQDNEQLGWVKYCQQHRLFFAGISKMTWESNLESTIPKVLYSTLTMNPK